VVRIFLIGCAVLLLIVGCAGTISETSNKKEQGHSPQATESEKEARCQGTRTYHSYTIFYRNGGMVDRTGSEEDMKRAAKKARHLAKREDLGAVKVKVWGALPPTTYPAAPRVACS